MKHGLALAIVAAAIPVTLAAGSGTADATTTAASVKQVRTRTAPAAGRPTLTKRAPATKPAPAARWITLTDADSGRRVKVRRGAYVLVSLRVTPDSDSTTWWHTVNERGRALQVRPRTAMSMRGVTLARFRAVTRGEATLSSSRAVCPQHGTTPTCHSMQGWSVTVDVR